jgi:adenosylmethionine-8-amino-7-oxononanoate aminotransferase
MEGYDHIWLPYTQMQHGRIPLPVVGAKGCTLHLADGRTLIDGIASWWSMCHGYQYAPIVEAITKQAECLSHVMFAGLAHEGAYRLASALTRIAPRGLERVFFAE